jgi:hypothetical protein
VLQVQQRQRAADDAEMLLAAAEALADAIRAGRLPRKPPMETLARIAAIITTAQPRQKKTAGRAGLRQAAQKEATVAAATSR